MHGSMRYMPSSSYAASRGVSGYGGTSYQSSDQRGDSGGHKARHCVMHTGIVHASCMINFTSSLSYAFALLKCMQLLA